MENSHEELETYEKPILEVVEFKIEESIAISVNFSAGAICTENLWGSDE